MARKSYEVIAAMYDKVSANDCNYDRWLSYITDIAAKHGVKKIVDLACGTGKVSCRLVKSGFSVVGVDSSRQMLTQARQKCRALFVEQDMTQFALAKPTDMAVCVNDGVNYLSGDKLSLFFQRVAANLKPHAPFVFDYSSPYKLQQVIANNVFYVDEQDYTLLWTNQMQGDSALRMNLTVFANQGDELYTRQDETHLQHLHQLQDVVNLLDQAGFDVVEVSDDYGNKLTQQTQRICLYCVKR